MKLTNAKWVKRVKLSSDLFPCLVYVFQKQCSIETLLIDFPYMSAIINEFSTVKAHSTITTYNIAVYVFHLTDNPTMGPNFVSTRAWRHEARKMQRRHCIKIWRHFPVVIFDKELYVPSKMFSTLYFWRKEDEHISG